MRKKEKPLAEYLCQFYWRRSLRIFPLYFVFLAVSCAVYLATRQPNSFSADWPYLVSYTTNFGRLRTIDVGPAFVHLWSLAAEEQFYLLWPLLVWFLPLATFKRIALTILAFTPLIRLSLYLFFRHLGHDTEWMGRNIYCLPISQFDAFASGAAIVLWRLQDLRYAGRWLCAILAVTAICGAAVLAHEHLLYKAAMKWSFGYSMYLMPAFGFVWGYSLLNLLSMIVIVVALQRLPVSRFLELKPIVRVGTISYGIYVYHVPVLLLIKPLAVPGLSMFAFYCATVIVISEISYRYLETPFLLLKEKLNSSRYARGQPGHAS